MLRYCLLLSLAVLVSCAPTAPVRSRGFATIDSFTTPGEVRLFWHATTDPPCVDIPCPPPGPRLAGVLLQQSISGPFTGWRTLATRATDGSDSATVTGLDDGRPYWFRIVGIDVTGRQVLTSNPVVTMPGPRSVPALSVPVDMSGRFSWSASGDTIAFADASVSGEPSLAVIDLRTLARTRVATYAGDEWIMDAIWSNDGATIAFTHTPTLTFGGIDYRVWTTPLVEGAPVAQTTGRVDFDPAWGGSGWLYFCRGTYEPPNVPELWRVRPGDVSSMEAITSDPGVRKRHPSVRPLDDWIVYQGEPRNGSLASGLFTVRPGGGPPVPLTPLDWYADTNPFWSPDGQSVVFVSTRSGHPEVWSVHVGSGTARQITRGPRGASRLCARWSPDGTRLAVLDGRQGGSSARGRLEVYDTITGPP